MLKRLGAVLLILLVVALSVAALVVVSKAKGDSGHRPLLGYGVEIVESPEPENGIVLNKDRSRL